MTNVFGTPEKVQRRDRLWEIAVDVLEKQGWSVSRIPGIGKASVRRITRGSENLKISIRTSQDTFIAFPRNRKNTGWLTLADVDAVVAVSVDDGHDPKFAKVHLIPGDDMRRRFDRAYEARRAAGHKIQPGRGVWLSLYREEAKTPVVNVGAGAGLVHREIAKVPLNLNGESPTPSPSANPRPEIGGRALHVGYDGGPLTIAEAKRGLALHFGVDQASIKITVEA